MDKLSKKIENINIADVLFFGVIIILFVAPEHALFSQVANILIVAFTGISLLEKKGDFKFHSIFIVMVLFVLICFISCLYSVSYADSFTRTKTMFRLLILLCGCLNYFSEKKNLDKFVWFYATGAITSCLYIMVMENIFSGDPVGTSIANQNQVGTRLALGVVFMIYSMIVKFKWWKFIPIALSLGIIILTGSRSSLIVLVVSSVFMIILGVRARRKSVGLAVLGILAAVLVVIYLIFNVDFFYQAIGGRLEQALDLLNTGDGDASSNLRANLIREGWAMFREKPILGMGFSTYKAVSKDIIGKVAYSHNDYMELLVGVGLVGTVTYYVMYGILVVCSLSLLNGKPRVAIYGALSFSLMTGIMTSNFFTVNHAEKTMVMIFAFVYCTYLVKKEERL